MEGRVDRTTNIAGIEIPSSHPAFLAIGGIHVVLVLACVAVGVVAMLSEKRQSRHPRFGTIYFWCLAGVFLTATTLASVRWTDDAQLCLLGTLSLAFACVGRRARQKRGHPWVKMHIIGMGTSYILLLTAFYVDNGKNLPLWKELPPIAV
jgi:hypothetical protein